MNLRSAYNVAVFVLNAKNKKKKLLKRISYIIIDASIIFVTGLIGVRDRWESGWGYTLSTSVGSRSTTFFQYCTHCFLTHRNANKIFNRSKKTVLYFTIEK